MTPVRSRHSCAVAFLLLFATALPAFAETRHEAEQRRTRQHREDTVFAGQALCVAAGGFLVWLAIAVARGGLGVGPGPRVTGLRAWIAAAVLAGAGLAVGVGGVMRVPDWIRPA